MRTAFSFASCSSSEQHKLSRCSSCMPHCPPPSHPKVIFRPSPQLQVLRTSPNGMAKFHAHTRCRTVTNIACPGPHSVSRCCRLFIQLLFLNCQGRRKTVTMATFERDLVCLRLHLMRKVLLNWNSIWNVVTLPVALLITWLSCPADQRVSRVCHSGSHGKRRQFCTHLAQNSANL